jgi:hypothetical protein
VKVNDSELMHTQGSSCCPLIPILSCLSVSATIVPSHPPRRASMNGINSDVESTGRAVLHALLELMEAVTARLSFSANDDDTGAGAGGASLMAAPVSVEVTVKSAQLLQSLGTATVALKRMIAASI